MSGKGTWIKYVIASGLIHAAILSAYVPMNASHRPDPIEVFVLDAPSPPSPLSLLGQVAKRTKMTGGPRAAGPKVKEQVSARSREQVAGPSELKTKSLPAAPASPPRNEVVANTGLLAPAGPEDGVTAGGSGTSGSGTSGSGSNGFAGGTGTGSGSGQDGGTGSSGTGFGAPGGPRFLHREVPEYPMLARRRGKEGTVNPHGDDRRGRQPVKGRCGQGFRQAVRRALGECSEEIDLSAGQEKRRARGLCSPPAHAFYLAGGPERTLKRAIFDPRTRRERTA